MTTPPSASPEASPPWARILGCGLLMGVAGDLLLRADGGPGLNFAVLLFGVATGIVVVLPAERRWRGETILLLGTGLALGASIALRDSAGVNALALVTASAAFALIALRGGRPWIARGGLSDIAEAIGCAVARAAAGLVPLVWLQTFRQSSATDPGRPLFAAKLGRVAVGARGLLIALPFLLLFGALLLGADPVFEELVGTVLLIDLDPVLEHLVPIGVLTWLAAGYFTGVWAGTRVAGLTDRRIPRSVIGTGEASVAIGLVDLLFLSFVIVQVRYLFGGAGLVEVTPGLTYAEYAREGAAELGVCAALAIPSLLLADWSVRRSGDATARRVFGGLAALQILLLLVVLASAFQRLRVYQDAYGLTLSRVYGTFALAWLGVIALLFVATVLRGYRDRFASLGLAAAVVAVGLLVVSNPEARIVKANVARMEASDAPDLDVSYLSRLSADAVPSLLDSMDRLPAVGRCRVAADLLDRWGPSAPPVDVRTWDLATARARRAVAGAERELAGALADGLCEEG